MLDPVSFDCSGARRRAASGDQPGSGQVALLPEICPQYPHIEVLAFHTPEPAFENPECRIDGDRLMVVGWGARSDRSGVAGVLPEEGPHTGPVALGETQRILAEELVNGVFVAPSTRWGAVFYLASRAHQETNAEHRDTQTAQADRWWVSRTGARSSSFSRRVPGVSSA